MRVSNRDLWTQSLFSGSHTASPARRTKEHPEQAILNCVLKTLRMHPRVAMVWRENTGGFKDARGQFVRFGFPGKSDLMGFMRDGRVLAIEVKAAKGRLSDDQEFFLGKIRANGGVSGVARSIADALAIVEERRME